MSPTELCPGTSNRKSAPMSVHRPVCPSVGPLQTCTDQMLTVAVSSTPSVSIGRLLPTQSTEQLPQSLSAPEPGNRPTKAVCLCERLMVRSHGTHYRLTIGLLQKVDTRYKIVSSRYILKIIFGRHFCIHIHIHSCMFVLSYFIY